MLNGLRTARDNSNLKQAEIARKLGISKQYYSQLERGERRLTYDMALAIAKIFKTTPDKIFLPEGYAESGQNATGTDGK